MRKFHFLTLFIAVILIAASCKKADNNTTTASYWHINQVSYNGKLATRVIPSGLQSLGTGANMAIVYFLSYPAASKNFKIVNYGKRSSLADDECVVEVDSSAFDLMGSTGYDGLKAAVSVAANGKLTINVPSTWARHYNAGTPQSDSVKVDAFMTEE